MGQGITSSNKSSNSLIVHCKSSIPNFDKLASPTQIQKLDHNPQLVKAFNLLKYQQYENAIELIDRILLRSPNIADAQYLKGLAYLGLNNLQQALYFCQKATQLDKKHSKAMAEIGNIYILNKKYQEALNVFNKLIEMNERSFEGYFGMAFVLTILNNFEKAQYYYETALQLKQNDKGALLNYGHLKVKQQNYNSALELYQQALKQDKICLEAIQSICNLFMIQKHYENLHEFCDKQLEQQKPQIKIAILNCKSQAYFSQKLFDRSINLCNEVLELDSKNLEGLFGMAMNLFNLNQLNQSLEYFQKIINEYPKEIKSLKMIIKIQSTLQQYTQLREYCDQLIKIDQTDFSSYFFRGIAFMNQQNYLSALDDFNQVIAHDYSNFMATKHKGFCLSMLKMFNQAIQCYDQIIKYILDPKEKSILLFEKGFCHLKLHQNLTAKQNFEEAMEIDFNNQELKLKIANIARDNKIYEYANKVYNQLINENGKIPSYYIEKAQMYELCKDYVNAKLLYDELINLNTHSFEYYLKRSKIRIQLQQFSEAIQDLYQGIKLDDQQSELYFELGQIFKFQQNFKEAAEMFHKACTLNDNIEKYHIKYSITMQMLQANDEAIQHLEFVLQKHPDFDDCKDVLENFHYQSCQTKEYIQLFSFILISVLQEGIIINNLNKDEIQDQIRNLMEKKLKTIFPRIPNIFEIIFDFMSNQENFKIINNQNDLKSVLNNLYNNNFNSIEQFVKYIIEVSKRIALKWACNSKKENGIIITEIQRETMNLGLENQFNKFQNTIVCTAIGDCLGLLLIIITNSNGNQSYLKNMIDQIITDSSLIKFGQN